MGFWLKTGNSFYGGPNGSLGRASRLLIAGFFCLCLGIPHTVWIGDAAATCIDCHVGIEPIAVGEMAEQIHQIGKRHGDPAGCIVCHGGDPIANDDESAHRGAPDLLAATEGPNSFYPDPGNIWVADRTCGQCHKGYAERWRKSVMSTEAETISRELCDAAWKKRTIRSGGPQLFGRYSIADEDGPEPIVGSPLYKSFIRSLVAKLPEHFPPHLYEVPVDSLEKIEDKHPASCERCHGEAAQSQPRPGCSACHIPYGTGQGRDPSVHRTKPGAPLVHRIQGTGNTRVAVQGTPQKAWSGIPLESCFQCHFDPRLTSVNDIGDAFVHYGARHDRAGRGLLCQDCHTSIEMHGDGNIAGVNAAQTEVRCEDCHGTMEQLPWELPLGYEGPEGTRTRSPLPRGTVDSVEAVLGEKRPAKDGYLLTSRGNPFGNVIRDGDQVLLYSASGDAYQVTLLKYLNEQKSWRSELSKQVKSEAGSHKDMACTDCHADWLPPCLGCHADSDAEPNSRRE